jgi:hypothetical protein
LAALKLLSIDSYLLGKSEEHSVLLTNAIFVKALSLMHLEYFSFDVENARVITREHFYHTLIFKSNILLEWLTFKLCFIFFVEQLTRKAFAALLEGPFADSILESPFFLEEYRPLQVLSNLDETTEAVEDHRHSLELLKKLEDRMEEHRRKFPWKTLYSDIDHYENLDLLDV